jgi:hypothetical protein
MVPFPQPAVLAEPAAHARGDRVQQPFDLGVGWIVVRMERRAQPSRRAREHAALRQRV